MKVKVYVRLFVVSFGIVFIWFFFFKQKTAYEMRISDWSSDVCSSDQIGEDADANLHRRTRSDVVIDALALRLVADLRLADEQALPRDRFEHARHAGGQIGRASCRERVCQYV